MLAGDPPKYRLGDMVGMEPIPEEAQDRTADTDPPKIS